MQRSNHLELHQIGTRTMLAVAPRGVAMGTDEVHVGIGGAVYDTYGKSVLLSRSQVEDLHAWLTQWLAEGWDGVVPVQGPTSAEVIEHYRDIAGRERVRADHERIDGARRLKAAMSLIPADVLSTRPDLEAIASQHAVEWQHLQNDADRGEQARLIFIAGLHDIEQVLDRRHDLQTRGQAVDDAETTLAKLRKALRRLVKHGAHPVLRPSAPDCSDAPPDQARPRARRRLNPLR